MNDNSIYYAGFIVIATIAVIVLTCIFHLELTGEAENSINMINEAKFITAQSRYGN